MKKLTIILLMLAASLPSLAGEVDEGAVREIVRQEVERLLQGEAFDSAVEAAITRMVRRQQAASRAEQLRPVDENRDHIYGKLDAPLTFIEYSDFECPFCKRFHPTVINLMEANADKLRWVYRHYPLTFHNPGAQKQAEASECVAELAGNDAFWQFTHAIYRQTESGGNGFALDALRPLAESVGANGKKFDTCLDDGRTAARVFEDYEDGMKLGISGTPAGIFVNRRGELRFVFGALSQAELQEMIDELL